ncbi:AsmA family protein [Lichenicola sp.]|uniref:AsmA family protein n=1 Tax=Lichenicola sp. TaxID=2804529 RepID=UPI003B00DC6E
MVLIILLILFWSWDWFIPLVDSQATAAVGRKVTIQHLHVRLGSVTGITADGVAVAGTDQFPKPLATTDHLTVNVELLPLIRHRQIVLPLVDLDHPVVDALAQRDGTNNWTIGSSGKTGSKSSSSSQPLLGVLRIEDGHVHVDDPKLKANFNITVATEGTPDPAVRPIPADQGHIVADATGTYAGQPITGHFVGGAILSLRDKARPYPIDLRVANGPTHVSLAGTIEQPLTFGGARLKLVFAGPDMSLLFPLTGVPIPQTPPYSVTGALDYSRQRIVFRDFKGKVGSSDLNGTITVLPKQVPDIDAELFSHNVDLADLGGFIGTSAGHGSAAAPAQKAASKAGSSKAASNGDVLPTTPINMPKIKAADVHLAYRGDHIENRDVPLDNIVARLDIRNGDIDLKQLDFKVGTGTIFSSASLDPVGSSLKTRMHVDFHRVDLSRLLQATHTFHGQGVIGGKADLTTEGNSIATMLGNGSGGLTLVMSGGGDISALLPDIAGLEVGNAILSAIGLPSRAAVQCFVLDMPLKDGILSTNTFLLQTSEARSVGKGTVDFRNQTLDYSLTTRSTHFSVGSLPGPINIIGKLGKPGIMPGAEVVARAGAATGLGIVLAPLALLPTIQFGVGDAGVCAGALQDTRTHPAAPSAVVPAKRHRR